MARCSVSGGASIARYRQGGLTAIEVSREGLHELYVTGVPRDAVQQDSTTQAQQVYGALGPWLRERGATGVQERVFGSLRDREAVLAARQAALSTGAVTVPWPAAWIEGAPPERDGLAGVQLYAVAGPECSPVTDQGQLCGVAFDHEEARHVYLTGLQGPACAGGPEAAARCMLAQANRLLQGAGCAYTEVVRTWIYLCDILDWYDQFNAVRSAAYAGWGLMGPDSVGWLPASTGIEGRPPAGGHASLDLYAIGGPGRQQMAVERVHNPLQNEANSYGSAFARGVAVGFGGAETVYVSGTAAIDEAGHSVHEGDLDGQLTRTLDNIAALLSTRGMGLADIAQATVFVKHGVEAERAVALLAEHGMAVADGVVVRADVCRPELLFEVDATAVGLPRD